MLLRIKLNRKIMLLSALSLVLLIITFMQYGVNRNYRSYLDQETNRDFQNLAEALSDNEVIYQAMKETSRLQEEQRLQLIVNNQEIADLWFKYQRTAIHFGLEPNGFQDSVGPMTAMRMTGFFAEENSGPLTENDLLALNDFVELNAAWSRNVHRLVAPGSVYDFKSSFWTDDLQGMENATTAFLQERNVEKINELWWNRIRHGRLNRTDCNLEKGRDG